MTETPDPQPPVDPIAVDYRRAAVMFLHLTDSDRDVGVAGFNAVVHEITDTARLTGLLHALVQVAVDAAPELRGPDARQRLHDVVARMAVFEAEDPTR